MLGIVLLNVVVWYIIDFFEDVYWMLLLRVFIFLSMLFVVCFVVDLNVK